MVAAYFLVRYLRTIILVLKSYLCLGSGNIGATNVYRVMGKNWGLFTFLLDALKGFIPAYFLWSGVDPRAVGVYYWFNGNYRA